jgi:hypothetical protein
MRGTECDPARIGSGDGDSNAEVHLLAIVAKLENPVSLLLKNPYK